VNLPFSFLKRRRPSPPREPWQLSTPLLRWSETDRWTIGDAVTGTLITGATGSGKTTGSGQAIARAFLRAGFGGLVLTTKPDERALWERYCREAGREGDLKVFNDRGSLRFNFLDYEATRSGEGAGLTENLVNVFSTVLEVADRGSSGGQGREDEGYWRRAARQLIRNAVELLTLSHRRISVPDLYRVVISAPTSTAQKRSTDWQAQSLCFQCLKQADQQQKSPREQSDLEVVADYFLLEFCELSDKTRSVVVSTFTSMADVLMRGLLRELFCNDTNITPEAVTEGAIILVDLPVKTFGEIGTFAQVLWKYAFQRSIERRDLARSPRPVFLWADEAQNFITSYDMQFQTTCRSSLVATAYLTQNISNVHAALGGQEKGRTEAASLFANLNTKVFHANGDPVTNEWAASLIGRSRQFMSNGNSTRSSDGGWPFALGIEALTDPGSTSAGFSEVFEFDVQPARFTQLRTGGPANAWAVDGLLFQNGRRFSASGKTWLSVSFDQRK
jgi:hypothetical protein